ncbi:cupredoxin domain-containing protein [Dyella caseinilytica]|uniref:Cupredoxin family protein n=1 Tax=Dyella caseinilytica TaxID=1849581 RepID=A0ABX7GQL1_9GAMM|nr:cupredoxin family protein [Dyella caseinilytica]QRN52107.1 cupredoxin family protein [Dyella caseinilytica]GGA15336.1 hypothetical protein GCM10011408_41610 [Dyella caseinilytica]
MRYALTSLLAAIVLMAWPSRALANLPYESMAAAVQERMESFWFGHRAQPSQATRTIVVVMQGSRFIPANMTVRRGETVRFQITNRDRIAHEFVLGDAAEQAEHEREMASMPGMPMNDPNGVTIAPGTTGNLVWTFTSAGELQYACHLPGHYEEGMVGQLTISE